MKKILLTFSVVVFFVACDNANKSVSNENVAKSVNSSISSNNYTSDKTSTSFQVDLVTSPAEPKAGEPVQLTFFIRNSKGELVKNLQIVHEKKMHLLIVSEDLQEFYHIHPQQNSDGKLEVSHVFPYGGNYRIFADFTPEGASQVIDQKTLNVKGPERKTEKLVPDEKLEKEVENIKVILKIDSEELIANKELTLGFDVLDSKSGKPVTNLEKYLGELAHFVVISEDLRDFVHVHPMSEDDSSMKRTDHDEHAGGDNGHSHHHGAGNKKTKAMVYAHLRFPRAGIYKLWAEFKREGKVIIFPFVLKVN